MKKILPLLTIFTIGCGGGSSSPKVSEEKKNAFKDWAIKSTAVTYLEFPDNSDYSIWVKMTADKYASKQNAEVIAQQIGRYYKTQTGYDGMVITTVWDYNNKIFVKGKSNWG